MSFVSFDRSFLKKKWKANSLPLGRAAAIVRANARQSIRKVKSNKPSKPNNPPRSRSPAELLRKILFYVDPLKTRAIVGPVGLGKSGKPATEVLEKGGTGTTRFTKRVRNHRIKVTKSVSYPKRPYMLPALEKAKTKFPSLWKGIFK